MQLPNELVLQILQSDKKSVMLYKASSRFYSIFTENVSSIIKATRNQQELDDLFIKVSAKQCTRMCAILLKIGISTVAVNRALQEAADDADILMIKILLTIGARIEVAPVFEKILRLFRWDAKHSVEQKQYYLDFYKCSVKALESRSIEYLDGMLQHAVKNGHIGITSCLIRAGANPNTEGALAIAVDYGHIVICKMLLKHGAIVGRGDLMIGIDAGNVKVIKLLLKYSSNLVNNEVLRYAQYDSRPAVISIIWDAYS